MTDTTGIYVASVDIQSGVMGARWALRSPGLRSGPEWTVFMTPTLATTDPASMVWTCSSALTTKYVPSICR